MKSGARTARGRCPGARSVCPSPRRASTSPLHRRPSHSGSPTVHQSPHILVTSPQVRAELRASGGQRGGRRAWSARAVGAGARRAAARAGWRGRGGTQPVVASARQPAPSDRPQPRTHHARSSPPVQPSARPPPSDCAPATVAACSSVRPANGHGARRPVGQWARLSAQGAGGPGTERGRGG